jgi:hypothetical protein
VSVHPIRHDRAKEHHAFATPKRAAPPSTGCAGRGQHQGHAAARSAYRRALSPDPLTRRCSQRRGTIPQPRRPN